MIRLRLLEGYLPWQELQNLFEEFAEAEQLAPLLSPLSRRDICRAPATEGTPQADGVESSVDPVDIKELDDMLAGLQ